MQYIEAQLKFTSSPPSSDQAFEDLLDCIMDELSNIGVQDADLTASFADRSATFVGRLDDSDAIWKFITDLRTALHAASCQTPGWPTLEEILGVRQVRDRELLDA